MTDVTSVSSNGEMLQKDEYIKTESGETKKVTYINRFSLPAVVTAYLNEKKELKSYSFLHAPNTRYQSESNYRVAYITRDDNGNWLRKANINDDGEIDLMEREIEYFDGTISGDIEVPTLKDKLP